MEIKLLFSQYFTNNICLGFSIHFVTVLNLNKTKLTKKTKYVSIVNINSEFVATKFRMPAFL